MQPTSTNHRNLRNGDVPNPGMVLLLFRDYFQQFWKRKRRGVRFFQKIVGKIGRYVFTKYGIFYDFHFRHSLLSVL